MEIEEILSDLGERAGGPGELRPEVPKRLEELRRRAGAAEDASRREELLRELCTHRFWRVRSLALELARDWLPLRSAEEAICNGTHDSVDVVAFKAIRLCGERRLRSGIAHLTRISGWPSNFARSGYLRKPVGIGAALTKNALFEIFGTRDPDALLELEREFLAPYQELLSPKKPDLRDMVHVPAGVCIIGTEDCSDFRFEYRDFIPRTEVDLPGFWIDRHPVTNAAYAEFAQAIDREGHATCHPDEPDGKQHWPAHMGDPRFSAPDMPVTGIDWYDAYAYAGWVGKSLPSETQWEKAARGTDGRTYPWGNQWNQRLTSNVETAMRCGVKTLAEWEAVLRTVSDTIPEQPVWRNGSRPESASPYGAEDMAGNVWEWTRTNFFTKDDMDPFFRRRSPSEFMNRQQAFAVIRGGCWTSVEEIQRTYFRGKDLLTDRHFEIGFRCVVEDT